MGREGRATNDGVGLPKTNHVVKSGRQAIEETLESFSRQFPQVQGEQWCRKSKVHQRLSQIRVFVPRQGITLHLDTGMVIEEASQNQGVDTFPHHANIQSSHPLDYLEGCISIQESAFDVVHVPKQSLFPGPSIHAFLWMNISIFPDHAAGIALPQRSVSYE